MRRRHYVATTVGSLTGLAGCLETVVSNVSRGTGDSFPTVSADGDSVPSRYDADIDVRAVDQFSADSPARLRVTYTNTGDSEREVEFTISPPFPPYAGRATDDDARLALIPDFREYVEPHPRPAADEANPFVPDEPDDGCWRAKAAVSGEDVGLTRTLGPDESVEGEYALLAHPKSESCLAASDYRFEDPHYFETDEPWGFTVSLRR